MYQFYLPYVLTIARRYGISYSDEPDVIQEIFIEVFVNIKKYDSRKAELKTWIRTIAVHKLLNIKRKKGVLDSFRDVDSVSESEGKLINYQEHKPEYLMRAIAELPEGYRMVFNLYEVDGYTHPEIAAMLGITEAGSRSQLSRARAGLRKKLIKADLKG